MLDNESATNLKDWADESKRLETALRENNQGRNEAIRMAMKIGAGVGEIVKMTGLTRVRVYQIRDGK